MKPATVLQSSSVAQFISMNEVHTSTAVTRISKYKFYTLSVQNKRINIVKLFHVKLTNWIRTRDLHFIELESDTKQKGLVTSILFSEEEELFAGKNMAPISVQSIHHNLK